jgi:hypothetical protein
MLPRALLLLLLLALSGCAEVWLRPGTTEAEADAANAACRGTAHGAVPPWYETRLVSPPRVLPREECFYVHGRRVCRVVGTIWVPAQYATVDLNAPARDDWRRGCMAKQGFTYGGLRPLRL